MGEDYAMTEQSHEDNKHQSIENKTSSLMESASEARHYVPLHHGNGNIGCRCVACIEANLSCPQVCNKEKPKQRFCQQHVDPNHGLHCECGSFAPLLCCPCCKQSGKRVGDHKLCFYHEPWAPNLWFVKEIRLQRCKTHAWDSECWWKLLAPTGIALFGILYSGLNMSCESGIKGETAIWVFRGLFLLWSLFGMIGFAIGWAEDHRRRLMYAAWDESGVGTRWRELRLRIFMWLFTAFWSVMSVGILVLHVGYGVEAKRTWEFGLHGNQASRT